MWPDQTRGLKAVRSCAVAQLFLPQPSAGAPLQFGGWEGVTAPSAPMPTGISNSFPVHICTSWAMWLLFYLFPSSWWFHHSGLPHLSPQPLFQLVHHHRFVSLRLKVPQDLSMGSLHHTLMLASITPACSCAGMINANMLQINICMRGHRWILTKSCTNLQHDSYEQVRNVTELR